MTAFTADVHQNQYLPIGGTTIDAIVRVTATGAAIATSAPARAEVLIVDLSGSMTLPRSKFKAALAATTAAIDCIEDGVAFGVIGGTQRATRIYPARGELAIASEEARTDARAAVRDLEPGGGTAMGTWLASAKGWFAAQPEGIHHAILMTDGMNQNETRKDLAATLRACDGQFQCDCRGIGEDWEVEELRTIASALLGSVDIVADPSDADAMTADFVSMMHSAMGKAVHDVALRVWTPRGATVDFVKQVNPSIEDLTPRRLAVSDLIGEYPTGAWGSETRDFHVRIAVPARGIGDEMLAGRVSLMVEGQALTEAKLIAIWTDDPALSTKIDHEVARATGHAELAENIQEGIRAWNTGDDATATRCIGRAVQLAHEAGDQERLDELAAFAEIENAATGTVVVRKDADKVAAMTLDTHSTKTVREVPVAESGSP
jgi:hypothetical protein